jgi:hypothetical protein
MPPTSSSHPGTISADLRAVIGVRRSGALPEGKTTHRPYDRARLFHTISLAPSITIRTAARAVSVRPSSPSLLISLGSAAIPTDAGIGWKAQRGTAGDCGCGWGPMILYHIVKAGWAYLG